MARLSSQYDKEVGKVFVMRGDEAYARTTDSRVKVMASDRTDFNNYRVGLLCNVYRDRGESKITLYNGDIVVNQFDWSDNTEQMYIGMNNTHTAIDPDTCLELAWGVPHEVYIRYKGNNQCLPSKSKVLNIFEPLPDEYATNIVIDTDIVNNNVDITVTIDINGVATVGTHDTDIEIYLDGEIADSEHPTINTGDSNVATTTFTNLENGIHTISAIVVGSDKIHTATAYEEVVIGNHVEITEYPSPFIIGIPNTILVSVKRYDDTPISGGSVSFNGETYTTDEDGIATVILTNINDGEYYAEYNGVESNTINIVTYEPSINVTVGNGIVSIDKNDTISVALSKPISGIPVTLTKRYRSSSTPISQVTLHTDSDGIATRTISGSGEGTLTYDAQAYYSPVTSVDVDDVIYHHNQSGQRWGENNLKITNGSFADNTNGRTITNVNGQDPIISFIGNKGNSWELSFSVALSPNYDNIVAVETNSGEYFNIYATLSMMNPVATIELKYDNGTLRIYAEHSLEETIRNCNPTGNLKIGDLHGASQRRGIFYNMKLVRTR